MNQTIKIYTSQIQLFLDYADQIDNLIWNFYVFRQDGFSRNASYVIGLYDDEIVSFYTYYANIITELEEKLHCENHNELIVFLQNCIDKLPENRTDSLLTGKAYQYLTPIDYIKRFKYTLSFQSDIRQIYAHLALLVTKISLYLEKKGSV